jgi:uncharacterized RDD family membrane protein YckC
MYETQYGGFWRRVVAFVVDKCVLALVSVTLFFIGSLLLGLRLPSDFSGEITGSFLISYYGTTTVLNMVYFTYFHGTVGQTPGKMMLGLKVIQRSGAPMTLGVAFLRWVGYIISGLVFNLGYLWVAFDSRKRGWHDMIAATYVIKMQGENIYKETQ